MRKRLFKVNTTWTPELAYSVGIIATDGNLSPDGRHLNITSRDEDMVLNIKKLLCLENKIGRKARGGSKEKIYYVIQFGDVNFYEFLLSIGLTPAKSKTLKKINIPDKYFADFLRGCIDGDGSIGFSMHPESQYPQWRVRLCSASLKFLKWVLESLKKLGIVEGGTIYMPVGRSTGILAFGISDTKKVLNFVYYNKQLPTLQRKYLIAADCLNGRMA